MSEYLDWIKRLSPVSPVVLLPPPPPPTTICDFICDYRKKKISEKEGLVVIIIDMQPGFLKKFEDVQKKPMVSHQVSVIRWCAKKDISIVVLEYKPWGERNKDYIPLVDCGKTIDVLEKELEKVAVVRRITKYHADGFEDTDLDEVLLAIGAEELYFMGTDSSCCILHTANSAKSRYRIVTSPEVIYGTAPDKSISWYKRYGTVVCVADFIARLKSY